MKLEIFLEAVALNTGKDVLNAIIDNKLPIGFNKEKIEDFKWEAKNGNFLERFVAKIDILINRFKENNIPQNEIKNFIIIYLKYYKNSDIPRMINNLNILTNSYRFDGVLAYIYNRKKPKSPEIQKLFDDFEKDFEETLANGFEQKVNNYFDTNKNENTKKEYNVEYIYPSKKPEPSYKGWEIFVPKDFEAARNTSWLLDSDGHRTEKTHWCTAANENYFNEYTRRGLLYIFRNNSLKLMMQFNGQKVMDSKNDINFDKVSFLDFEDSNKTLSVGMKSILKEVPQNILSKVWGSKITNKIFLLQKKLEKDPTNTSQGRIENVPYKKIFQYRNEAEARNIAKEICQITNITKQSEIKKIIDMLTLKTNYHVDLKKTISQKKVSRAGRVSLQSKGNFFYLQKLEFGGYEHFDSGILDNDPTQDMAKIYLKNKESSIVKYPLFSDVTNTMGPKDKYYGTSNKREEQLDARIAKKSYYWDRDIESNHPLIKKVMYSRKGDEIQIELKYKKDDNDSGVEYSKRDIILTVIDGKGYITYKLDKNIKITFNNYRAENLQVWKAITSIPKIAQWMRDNKLRASVKTKKLFKEEVMYFLDKLI